MPGEGCHRGMIIRTRQKAAPCALISRALLRVLPLVAMTSFLCATGVALGADLSQATVQKKVNVVTIAPSLAGEPKPAGEGTVILPDSVVRTGTASRALLQFVDLTQARLGGNSMFSWDARTRAMDFKQGAVLISKPTDSGPIDLRSGSVAGSITGSTVFVSTVPTQGSGKGHSRSNGKMTTIIGMLEGKIHGGTRWTDSAGREHNTPFRLGPGEMLVARPDGAPRMAQFDIPRFVKTSPLVKMGPLPNAAALDRAIANYRADERGGFIDQTNVMVVTTKSGSVWDRPPNAAIEVSVAELNKNGALPFLPVGSTGVIRGQLVWRTDADLDLYLTLPNGQQVSFQNVSVTFNNGNAIARLDHDNLGRTIDIQPNIRVENIVVNGVPLAGLYRFFVNNFGSKNSTDPFTLTVSFNGRTQVINGNVANGQNSPPVIVRVPGG